MYMLVVPILAAVLGGEPPSAAGDDLLQIVQQAAIGSWKSLTSGEGRGTYRRQIKGRPDRSFALEIAFDGDKYNLKTRDVARPASKDRPFDRRIVVSDESATFTRTYGETLDQGVPTAYAYPPGREGIVLAADILMELTKASRGVLGPKGLVTPSVRFTRLADGRLRATYDSSPFVTETVEASPEAGYNVILQDVFNKKEPRTGLRYTAEWKRDGNVWYVAAWTREEWMDGEVAGRHEFRYDQFVANPRLSPDLFTIAALGLIEGTRIVDVRTGPAKVHTVGDPQKLAEANLDTMAAQMESLPVRGQTTELQPERSPARWLTAINAIAIFAIMGIWYVYWRLRKRRRHGTAS